MSSNSHFSGQTSGQYIQYPNSMQDMLSAVKSLISKGEYVIIYDLEVTAANQQLAGQRAKAFVRRRNPFSIGRIGVTHINQKSHPSSRFPDRIPVPDTYQVSVGVEK